MQYSIINYKKVNKESPSFRIDSEFYSPQFIDNEKIVNNLKTYSLGDKELIIIRSGTTPKDRDDDLDNGVILLKTTNIRNKPVSPFSNYYHISEEINKSMVATELKEGDVLINIVGATLDVIGRVSIIPKNFPKSNITQAMALIRSKTVDLMPGYIFSFLLGKYGNLQAQRLARPTGQFNLNLQEIAAIRIPFMTHNFQETVENLIFKCDLLNNSSLSIYDEVEKSLLEELDFKSIKIDKHKESIRNLSDCFSSGRLDAEYWEPQYDHILNTLRKYKGGKISTIRNEFNHLKNNFKANPKTEYNYIEIGDVDIANGEAGSSLIMGENLPANAKIKFSKKQLITSKVRPNRGATTILENYEGYVGSQAFTVILEKTSMNLETLMVFLKLNPIKELLLRYNTGTSYPVVNDDDILNLPLPIINKSLQEKIAIKINQSKNLREKSAVLLRIAKKGVEIAIEDNEEKAKIWLNSEIKKNV